MLMWLLSLLLSVHASSVATLEACELNSPLSLSEPLIIACSGDLNIQTTQIETNGHALTVLVLGRLILPVDGLNVSHSKPADLRVEARSATGLLKSVNSGNVAIKYASVWDYRHEIELAPTFGLEYELNGEIKRQ